MIKIVYKVLIKAGCEQAFRQLAEKTLAPEAKKLPGCRQFSLFQNTANKREYIFIETWDNKQSIETYKENLITLLGDPHPDEEFPARMNDLIETDEDLI